jgi:hypothetical protein
VTKYLALIEVLSKPEFPDRPVDPGYGIPGEYPDQGLPGGGGGGERPDQGLPGFPGRPGHLPSRPGRPVDPGFGWGGGRPPSAGQLPSFGRPGRPVDPGYGVEAPGAGQLPTAYTQDQIGQPPAEIDDGKGEWVLLSLDGQPTWAWTQPSGDAEIEPPESGGGGSTKPVDPSDPGAASPSPKKAR